MLRTDTTFRCQFTLDSDAWYNDKGEIADYSEQAFGVLVRVADRVRRAETGGVIRDINGNKIGSWSLR